MRATQALLSLLAKYATFLRYCVVGALASGVFYCVANLSALLLKVDSRSEAQNLESTFESNAQNVSKPAQDSRIFDKNAEILQNNDSTNAARRQDFKTFESNAQNVSESAQDSRILELQIGVFQGSQGDKTSGLSTLRADEIHDFSPKAESTKEAQHSQTATLLGSLASFIFGYFAQMRLAFRAYPSHSTMLPRYLALLVLIAIYAQVITYLGAFFTLSYYLISAFIALSVPLFSYPLQKLWVFAVKTSKGGGRLERVSFLAKNGDYCGESAVTYAKVCALDSPCKAPFLAQKSFREEAESNEQSPDFSSTILESLFLLSLRALRGKAWQSPLCHCEPMKSAWQSIKSIQPYTKSLESIFQKVDSRGNALLSPFLWLIGLTPRSFMSPLLLAPYNNFSKINTLFTTAETMDCHADKSARNDRNNATSKKMDSSTANLESIFQNAATLSKPQAAGFLMKNWGFQGSGKGVTLAVMTASATAESTIFRKKLTPKMPNLL